MSLLRSSSRSTEKEGVSIELTASLRKTGDAAVELEGMTDPPGVTPEDLVDECGYGPFQWKLLWLTGACWAADSMEVMLLSFLTPTLSREWDLSNLEATFVTMVVMAGMFVGAAVFGKVSDVYGRKKGYTIVVTFTAVSGILSSLAPNYPLMLLLRFLVGFGIGGTHISFALFAEYLPSSARATNLVWLDLFWSTGGVIEAALAFLVLPTLGWRWLMAFSALPMAFLAATCRYVPESARWLIATGRHEEARAIIKEMRQKNKFNPDQEIPHIISYSPAKQGSFRELLTPAYRRSTLMIVCIMFMEALCYYGSILITPVILAAEGEGGRCSSLGPVAASVDDGSSMAPVISSGDIFEVGLATASEIPGLFLVNWMLDKVGRLKTQGILLLATATSFLTLLPCTSEVAEAISFCAIRLLIGGVYQATIIYIPEVYPTAIRSTAIGLAGSFAKLGGMFAPVIATLLAGDSIPASVVALAALCAIASILSFKLPFETKGRPML